MKKYELEEAMRYRGRVLRRLRALRDIPRHNVRTGDLGGWIQSEDNLDHGGDAWVAGEAMVFDEAKVSGDARIDDHAQVFGEAQVTDDARVFKEAQVTDNAQVYDSAQVFSRGEIFGNARVGESAWVSERGRVYGHAQISDSAWVAGNAEVYDDARIYGDVMLTGKVLVFGEARVESFVDFLTAEIYTSQSLRATAFRQRDGSWQLAVGCWSGTLAELRAMAESDEWVETPAEYTATARPELLAFVALCEARAARKEQEA